MDFNFSDEQRMLSESARRYVRERCSLEERRFLTAQSKGPSRKRWTEFAEMGWLALPLPEEQGGLGGGPVDLAVLMEELGRGLVNEPIVDSAIVCGTLLSKFARPPLLEQLITGEALPVLAHFEAGDRNEYEACLGMRAEKCPQGWKLHGNKQLVRHGDSATHWLITAKINGEGPPALFLVERSALPSDLATYQMIDGVDSADLQLDGLVVSDESLLSDNISSALQETLDSAVLALCAAAVGSMEAVMSMTAEYLKTRVQYGKPLSQFQALQHRMSEMFVETDQARAMLYRAIASAEGSDARARAQAISAAKWLISRSGLFVTAQGIQLHGGIGTTDECSVGHHYKAMVSFDKRFGDADFHLQRSSDLF